MFPPKVLQYSNYRKLYIAAFASELGLFITETALMLYVFDLSGEKNSILGFSRLSFLVFLISGSLIGGALGANRNRKHVLIFCEFVRIPIIACILLTQNPYLIILLSGLKSFFSGVFNPNRQTIINEIVPSEDIDRANGLFSSTNAALMIAGPLLGAFIYSQLGRINEIIYFDLFTYILGIVLLSRVRYTYKKVEGQSKALSVSDFKHLFSFMQKRTDLKALFANAASAGLCIGVLIPLLVPFTIDILGKTKQDYGIIMSLFGFGGVIGGFLSKKLRDHFPIGKILIFSLCIETICYLLWSLNTNFHLACALLFFWGVVVFSRFPNQLNYISMSVETNYLSRLFSLMELSFIVPNMIGSLFIIAFGDDMKVDMVLFYTALIFIFLVYTRLFTANMRNLFQGPHQIVKRESESFDSL